MAQLKRMDARLDTLSDELCQVNTHVGRIARQQFVMGAISATSIRRSEAQLQLKQPRMETIDLPASTIPSTSAPSLGGGVTLEAIMAQLQSMDALLDTLNDELCQVNTRVSRIAQQ